ncbi:hypothetical protein GCM10010284_11500 [Streptomyces rubiginosohelvolus]|nr:hypothetical protein GCM10010284_11500 [Streptomyces rubiginosohelvolus]
MKRNTNAEPTRIEGSPTASGTVARLGSTSSRRATPVFSRQLGKAPRLSEEEIEPYTVDEVKRLLVAADKRRNAARWAVALALGLRQGGRRWG